MSRKYATRTHGRTNHTESVIGLVLTEIQSGLKHKQTCPKSRVHVRVWIYTLPYAHVGSCPMNTSLTVNTCMFVSAELTFTQLRWLAYAQPR